MAAHVGDKPQKPAVPKTDRFEWLRDAIPEPVRANPMLTIGPVIGLIAMAYVGIAVMALNTHPPDIEPRRNPAIVRLEETVMRLGAMRNDAATKGLDAYRLDGERALDANNDGMLTVADLRQRFMEAAAAANFDSVKGVTLADYLRFGGSLMAFDWLDGDRDGTATVTEQVPHITELGRRSDGGVTGSSGQAPPPAKQEPPTPDEWLGVETTDPRTGAKLILDPVRAGWLQEMDAIDSSGNYRWRGNAIPAASFGQGQYGVLVLNDGREIPCFYPSRDPSTGTVTVIDDKGEIQQFTYGVNAEVKEWRVIDDAEHPAKLWYSAMASLSGKRGAANSTAWAILALTLAKAQGMAHEAEDAAKRALIYNPGLKELWPIVGVERRDGKLERKQ